MNSSFLGLQVANRLAKEPPLSAVYSSDLKRALETAQIIATTCGNLEVWLLSSHLLSHDSALNFSALCSLFSFLLFPSHLLVIGYSGTHFLTENSWWSLTLCSEINEIALEIFGLWVFFLSFTPVYSLIGNKWNLTTYFLFIIIGNLLGDHF